MVTARILSTDGEASMLSGVRMYSDRGTFREQAEQIALYDNGADHHLIDMKCLEETSPRQVCIGNHVVITSRDLRKFDEGDKEFRVLAGQIEDVAPGDEGGQEMDWHVMINKEWIRVGEQSIYVVSVSMEPKVVIRKLREQHLNDLDFGKAVRKASYEWES